jgi:hypothetical protein
MSSLRYGIKYPYNAVVSLSFGLQEQYSRPERREKKKRSRPNMSSDVASKHEDLVHEHIKRHSKANIDEYIQTTTFSDVVLHDVSTTVAAESDWKQGGS